MINRQATRGTGTKTPGKAPAPTKTTKEAGARASVKSSDKPDGEANDGGAAPAGDGARWRGEEVSSPSPLVASSAEEAASRAEGNGPVRAEAAARDPNPGTYTEKGPARRPRADDPDVVENEEEKRRSAAEDHAAQSSRHPPYGKL